MKRLIALLMLVALLLPVIPGTVQAAQGSKLIALTFDDGPDRKDTPPLLDGLRQRGAKVTFFMLGQNAKYYPDLVRQAYNDGHQIGSHAYDHSSLNWLTQEEVAVHMATSFSALDQALGISGGTYALRPPYGAYGEGVLSWAGAPLVLWSVDTLDWQNFNEYTVRDIILEKAYDGAVVLLHDIHGTSVGGALLAIDILQRQGYEFVTVNELFRRRGVTLENGKEYYHKKPNGTDLGPIPIPQISFTTQGETMEVTISNGSDAPIYYTTDGSVPKPGCNLYEGPFTVPYPGNIRAVSAYELNGSRSDLAILAPGMTWCAAPTLTLDGLTMTLTHPVEGIGLYYTLDGSKPTVNSIPYTGPVELPGEHMLRVVAGGGYYAMSEEVSMFLSKRGQNMKDVRPGDWYYDSIDRLAAMGLMSGVAEGCFAPKDKVTRGMLAALLYRASGDSLGEGWRKTSGFTDVPGGEWYAESVEWAYRNGVVSGYSATRFAPEGNITRQELCALIDRYLNLRGTPLPRAAGSGRMFSDYGKISAWAMSSVEAMTNAQLLFGDQGQMRPKGTATRGEVAAILCRMLDYEAANQPEPEPTDPPETTVPETTVPETTVPETTVPETTVPETTVPETTVPETTVPETTVPETTVPETTVPETTVPETTVPETTVAEMTASAENTGT